jgi:putative oxidoreductase
MIAIFSGTANGDAARFAIKEGRFPNRPSPTAVWRPPLLGKNLDMAASAEQPALMNSLKRFADPAYCLMRLVVGLLFACHGGQKILGFPPVAKAMQLDTLGMVGGYIELIGGLLIALGLFTHLAAFIACGMMAVAYFMVHAKGDFFPIINRGEPAVFYCFVFLFIFFYGGGRFSLDALIWKRTAVAPPGA